MISPKVPAPTLPLTPASLFDYYERKSKVVDEIQETYWSKNTYKRWFFKNRAKKVFKALNVQPKESVFDYGCGCAYYGILVNQIPDTSYTGEDNAASVARAKKYVAGNFTSRYGSIGPSPNQNKVVNKIICSEVLEHMLSPKDELTKLVSTYMNHNSRIVISVPNTDSYMEKAYRLKSDQFEFNEHIQNFTQDSILALMNSCGLTPINITYSGYLLPYPLTDFEWPSFMMPVFSALEWVFSRIPILKKQGWSIIVTAKTKA